MSAQPATTQLADYQPPDYAVDAVELCFDLVPARTVVQATLDLVASDAAVAAGHPIVLDGDELELLSLRLDGVALGPGDYMLGDAGLTIPAPGVRCRLEIQTAFDPAANTKLEGLYLTDDIFCTQCEAEGFRRITFFPDRPDVMTTYRVTIRADKTTCPVLLSNGNLVDQGDLDDGRHFATWHDPFPKPSYLFALVAGDLGCLEDTFTTASGRAVRLCIYSAHGSQDKCLYAMDALKRAMRWDEEVFGLEYDLDLFNIVAVNGFNMGAMENKSLNVFNAKYVLADPETATDDDYAFIESIVAHEYFHNWTGNRVTCRDWFQLSLKEGLTVFRDQQFSADMRSAAVQRIEDVRALRARQFPEDAGPLAHPVRPASYIEINNFYTATVYDKGAEVIRMMHTLLGPDGFRKGMDLYFARHDGQAVTCDDFAAAMSDANGADLEQFRLWYSQAGTPVLTVSGDYDADAHAYTMKVTQTSAPTPGQAEKAPLHLPLAVGLLDAEGRSVALRLDGEAAASGAERLLHMRDAEESYRFVDVAGPVVPSVNRGFAAPVKVSGDWTDDQRAFLMANDADPFNRWEATQQYATDLMLRMVAGTRDGTAVSTDAGFIEAMRRCIDDLAQGDKAFLAHMLALPGESYLAEAMEVIDVDAIHAVRQGLRRAIAEGLSAALLELYHGNHSNAPYSPDAAAAGQRALKNSALAYLSLLDDPDMQGLAPAQYTAADNMTDRMAALRTLAEMPGAARDVALDDFYRRFEDDPIVLDKWFGLQAVSAREDTLRVVEGLLGHPKFTLKNPNRVRALIGSFASGNQVRFHAADGAGYAFLADRVLELDALNPQVAARLLTPLGRWRRFDSGRQSAMKAQLERIAGTDKLSRDVYEIATKSLGD